MNNADIYKIKSNDLVPSRGKVLISEPFLRDSVFGRSVVLLIDHSKDGSMGLVVNKRMPLLLNEVIKEFQYLDDIPLHKGGPISSDILFYIHTLSHVAGALPISKGLYLNGDFDEIKRFILQGNPIKENIKFFLGYSGWEYEQLSNEIKENTWMIGKEDTPTLMTYNVKDMWKKSLGKLGSKYETWSRFPQIPSMN